MGIALHMQLILLLNIVDAVQDDDEEVVPLQK